jgi:hypothetical protein
LLKKFCQSIGLSSVVFLVNYEDLLGGGDNVRLHEPFALRNMVLAQIADIFILGLLIFLVLIALQRTRFYGRLKLLIAIAVPPYLLYRAQAVPLFVTRPSLLLALAALWAALLLLLLAKSPDWYRNVLRMGDAAGFFIAVFALLSIVQLLWIAHWKPGPQQLTATWTTSPQPPRDHPLLVWIVFDELSHDQLFDHRAPGLHLPNFDALRSQSTLFTDVQPVGYKTVEVIPSLLTGQPVDDFRYQLDNTFQVHNTGQHGWHKISGAQTVFHDAQQNGWRTAVVGWYNPYCSIYGDAIDQCYWMNLDGIGGIVKRRGTLWRMTYSPLRQMVREIESPAHAARDACNADVRRHRNTHLDLQQHATQLLKTDQADFIFLHLAVPHSPSIWSRAEGRFTNTCGSSYLDNLVLTDRTLGDLLQILQASPRWKDTTLIVEGDHGWRVKLWNPLPSWTSEDETASRGVFDPRAALLVHQAGQTQPQTNSTAWPLVRIHDVVEQVVNGRPVHF